MPYTDDDLRSAREALGALWPLLKPGLWHSTPLARYSSILEDGEIRPDGGMGGNDYTGSYAVYVNAVSLFDFESASEDEALGFFRQWSSHLFPPNTPLTVWIGLNRDLLPGRLIPARKGGELAHAASKLWYPRVEACHVGPVPANAFEGVLAVSATYPCEFETLAMGDAALPRLRELAEQWCKPQDELVRRLLAARVRANSQL